MPEQELFYRCTDCHEIKKALLRWRVKPPSYLVADISSPLIVQAGTHHRQGPLGSGHGNFALYDNESNPNEIPDDTCDSASLYRRFPKAMALITVARDYSDPNINNVPDAWIRRDYK